MWMKNSNWTMLSCLQLDVRLISNGFTQWVIKNKFQVIIWINKCNSPCGVSCIKAKPWPTNLSAPLVLLPNFLLPATSFLFCDPNYIVCPKIDFVMSFLFKMLQLKGPPPTKALPHPWANVKRFNLRTTPLLNVHFFLWKCSQFPLKPAGGDAPCITFLVW